MNCSSVFYWKIYPALPRSVLCTSQAYYLDPRLYFRHISYEYKPGGMIATEAPRFIPSNAAN
jgi:hypothetical protein